MTIDITLCPTPEKVRFTSKAEAKRFRKSKGFKTHAYLCDCGYHHLGNWHGTADRGAHRSARHGDSSGILGSEVSVRMAAEELNVTAEFFGQLLDAGAVQARRNHEGKWRVPVIEIERLKKLTWGNAA